MSQSKMSVMKTTKFLINSFITILEKNLDER